MYKRTFNLEFVGFSGFYDSIWSDYIDTALDNDLMNLHDSLSKLKINEFNCWQDMDYKQYRLDVASWIMDYYITNLNKYIGWLVEFHVKDVKVKYRVASPREYNFVTDRVFAKVSMTRHSFHKLMQYLRANTYVADKVIRGHFTDYDGFHSYYPNILDYWLGREFEKANDLELSYLVHCALCVALYNNINWRTNEDKEVNDVAEIYCNFKKELEDEVYYDIDIGYSDYVNWGMYQKELRHALDREKVVLSEASADVINDTLWPLVDDWKINDNNELVLK